LVVGVAAGGVSQETILLTGIAGLVAGALSMAAGEYISVQSQADTESADFAREKKELAETPEKELDELTGIYVKRGTLFGAGSTSCGAIYKSRCARFSCSG